MNELKALWEWVKSSAMANEVIVQVLVALIAGAILWGFARAARGVAVGFLKGRTLARLPLQHQRYRDRLDKDTFHIRHPWMKEGQVLETILVPVNVEAKESIGPVDFQQFFDQYLRAGPVDGVARHLVVLGTPGSGKSVAMRIAARSAWAIQDEDGSTRYVPVLLTFAAFRRHRFDVEATVVHSLRTRQFGDGEADPEGSCRQFAQDRIREGGLLLLFDGLDELKREDRVGAIEALCTFAKLHSAVPTVIACRSIPFREHRAQLDALRPQEAEMAKFAPAAVRHFVKRWRFDPPKNAAELIGAIETRPHLQDMVQNPLMLTIITFLYALPKYRLPDNRAQFYEICSRALLEEWDQAQAPERANQFDRPHKEELLARLARDHLTGEDPESDISEAHVLKRFAEWLEGMGLSAGQNAKVLDEIVDNSGLLVLFPPDGFRFPHQTFLEYFAALYYLRCGRFEDLAEVGKGKDARRRREVQLLYCGLTTDAGIAAKVIRESLAAGDVDFAMEVVCNARRVDPDAARAALAVASDRLVNAPMPGLVEHLSYLARNPVSAFAPDARRLLRGMLEQNLDRVPDPVLEALVLAVARSGEDPEIKLVIENFDRLRLPSILPLMGERAVMLIARIVASQEMPRERMLQWIESLRLAAMPRLLYETMNATKDLAVRRKAGIALGELSMSDVFWGILDDPELSEPVEEPSLARVMQRWGWPRSLPGTARGKKIAVLLAIQLSRGMIEGSYAPFEAPKRNLHPWLSYLAHALVWEEQFPRLCVIAYGSDIFAPQPCISDVTPRLARTLWTGTEKQLSRWNALQNSNIWFVTLSPLPILGIWSVLSLFLDGGWILPFRFAAVFFIYTGGSAFICAGIASSPKEPSKFFKSVLHALCFGPMMFSLDEWTERVRAPIFMTRLYVTLSLAACSIVLMVILSLFCDSWTFRAFLLLHVFFCLLVINQFVCLTPSLPGGCLGVIQYLQKWPDKEPADIPSPATLMQP